jgi:hypothetical protein
MNLLRFALAQATFVAFGAFIAFRPGIGVTTIPARMALAFLTGSVLLTLEAVAFSMFGIRWNAPPLALPLVVFSTFMIVRSRSRSTAGEGRPESHRAALIVATLVAVIPAMHAAVSFAIARGVSADYVYFWGVKAARFASAKGLDPAVLRWRFFDHAVPDYPPLVPVIHAWAALLSDDIPWTAVPVTSALWLIVAAVAIHGLLQAARVANATSTALFWFSALSISAVHSFSGGNAETPLVAFVSVACAAILVETEERPWARLVAGIALAGAVLTKVEGIVPVVAMVMGMGIRDWYLGRRGWARRALALLAFPASALALWFLYQSVSGLPVGYRPHGMLLQLFWRNLPEILGAFPRNLTAGVWGLGWLIPMLVMLSARRIALVRALPAFFGVLALFAFFVFDYLHDIQPPLERISWTLSRISQPALSLWILAAAVATGYERETRTVMQEPGTRPGDRVPEEITATSPRTMPLR